MCEIPSRRFNTVFTGLLLGSGSLPPDFANRCVKSLAVVLTRCSQVLLLGRGSLPPDFASQMCEMPSPCFSAAFPSFWLGRGSLPPDFTSRCVKSLALVLAQYFQAVDLVADHFRQIVPADV